MRSNSTKKIQDAQTAKQFQAELTKKLDALVKAELAHQKKHPDFSDEHKAAFQKKFKDMFINSTNEFLKQYGVKLPPSGIYTEKNNQFGRIEAIKVDGDSKEAFDALQAFEALNESTQEFAQNLHGIYKDLDNQSSMMFDNIQKHAVASKNIPSYGAAIAKTVASFIGNLCGALTTFVAAWASFSAAITGGLLLNPVLSGIGLASGIGSISVFMEFAEGLENSGQYMAAYRNDVRMNNLDGTMAKANEIKDKFNDNMCAQIKGIAEALASQVVDKGAAIS